MQHLATQSCLCSHHQPTRPAVAPLASSSRPLTDQSNSRHLLTASTQTNHTAALGGLDLTALRQAILTAALAGIKAGVLGQVSAVQQKWGGLHQPAASLSGCRLSPQAEISLAVFCCTAWPWGSPMTPRLRPWGRPNKPGSHTSQPPRPLGAAVVTMIGMQHVMMAAALSRPPG